MEKLNQSETGLVIRTKFNDNIDELATELDGLQPKESGKGLSANDYTTTEKNKLAQQFGVNTGDQDLSGLQPKESGKGLSTNDYTTTEKNKLANQSGTNTGDQDLTGLQPKENDKGLSTNDYTTTEKNKLAQQSGVNTGDQDLSNLQTKETGKGLSTNDYSNTDKKNVNGLINVQSIFTLLGGNNDGSADNKPALTPILGSNKTIFFPRGTYLFNSAININAFSNIKLIGESGTIFTTPINKLITIQGSCSNVEIANIKFQSTLVSSLDDTEGLIFIANYGATDIMTNISIHNNEFTNPNTKACGIKVVSEGLSSLIDGLFINYNRFVGIGRFGIETQNHNTTQNKVRLQNVDISNNYFNDFGTIQTGVSICAISVSGWGTDFKINYNEILDARMNTTVEVYYGIENAGAINCQTIGNIIRSTSFGFTGILGSGPDPANVALGQPKKVGWIIKDNIITLTGSNTDKTKIRGMDIANVDRVIISDNYITSDGNCIRLSNALYGQIKDNYMKTLTDNVMYVYNGSQFNDITNNTMDNSAFGSNQPLIQFNGSTTINNSTYLNKFTNFTGVGNGGVTNSASATNNERVRSVSQLHLWSPQNFISPLKVSVATGGSLEFGGQGNNIYATTNAGAQTVVKVDFGLDTEGGSLSTGSFRAGLSANKTANYAPATTVRDYVVPFDATSGNLTYTLPSSATIGSGNFRVIKKVDASANTVTVIGNIDGLSNYVLTTQYQFVVLVSVGSGTNWIVVGKG